MTDSATPRRQRFPLRLDDAQPKAKRFVLPPGQAAALPSSPKGDRALPRACTVAVVSPASAAPIAAPDIDRQLATGPYPMGGARLQMVERLRRDGCRDERVLQAMAVVPRHLFLDPGLEAQACEDTSLPIGWGQTISKPSVVARMLALLLDRSGPGPLLRVLEIGTGCGYQAAVLSLLARQVYSIERVRELYDRARDNLAPMRSDGLRLIYGDGRHGHAPNAPYDAIIAAAGGEAVPQPWLDQLAPGGRLVAPVAAAGRPDQVLVVVDRLMNGQLLRTEHEAVRFVPLESGVRMGFPG